MRMDTRILSLHPVPQVCFFVLPLESWLTGSVISPLSNQLFYSAFADLGVSPHGTSDVLHNGKPASMQNPFNGFDLVRCLYRRSELCVRWPGHRQRHVIPDLKSSKAWSYVLGPQHDWWRCYGASSFHTEIITPNLYFNRSSGRSVVQVIADLQRGVGEERDPSPIHVALCQSEIVYNLQTHQWIIFFLIRGGSLPLNKVFLIFKRSYASIQFCIQVSFLAVVSPTMCGFHLRFLFVFPFSCRMNIWLTYFLHEILF